MNTEDFKQDFMEGMRQRPKTLRAKYFYDEAGSNLFEKITQLDEYYITRCDEEILRENISNFRHIFGDHISLIEFGSGSSQKTRHLLEGLSIDTYIPLDISKNFLEENAKNLAHDFPHINIEPVAADYTKMIEFPFDIEKLKTKVVFFSGSTIGNFEPERAHIILSNIRKMLGGHGFLLIGVDLQKDVRVLEAAYNDKHGITAAFNLGLLKRANRELHANFNLPFYKHVAFFNEEKSRIEMHIEALANQAGLQKVDHFLDSKKYFSNQIFRACL
ncbi:MAG: L-histidine N(alpha)-methyltransferase [Bdellovibrionota bacterium]